MQKGGFTLYLKVKGCVVQSLSHVRLFVTPWTASAFPLGWPWEAQSSPRVARESWGLRSSHRRAEETSPRCLGHPAGF